MKKNILGIVASGRRLGNTELIVKEIISNVPEPCTREMIRLPDLKIEPCKACYGCLKPETSCKIKDDFQFILNKIEQADAIILGTPVYFLGPHASLKLLIDRLLGAGNYAFHTRNKPCVVVTPFGIPGWQGYSKSAVLALPRVLEMKVIEFWQINAALPGESLATPENLQHAKELGLNIFAKEEYAKGPYECPNCGSDCFRLLPGGLIECSLCASRGQLETRNAPNFLEADNYRFSTDQLQRHFKVDLPGLLNKYLREHERLKEVQRAYRKANWWVAPEDKQCFPTMH